MDRINDPRNSLYAWYMSYLLNLAGRDKLPSNALSEYRSRFVPSATVRIKLNQTGFPIVLKMPRTGNCKCSASIITGIFLYSILYTPF